MRIKTMVAGLLLSLYPYTLSYAQGTAPVTVGWYNGDWITGIPGLANWYQSDQNFARGYDDFVVPQGGWTVVGAFSYNDMTADGVTEASWEIRSGVSEGNPGTVVASGRSLATLTLAATLTDGTFRYRVQVDGLRVQLPAGTYWLSVTPVTGRVQSYLSKTLGANAVGNPAGNDGHAFFYSPVIPNSFFVGAQSTGQAGTGDDFSMGVLISSAPSTLPFVSAIVNAANFHGGPVSPGEIVTIGGTGIGPASPAYLALDYYGNVSTSIGGVQVRIGGVLAPLTYVSATQINAVVPYEVAAMPSAYVQVAFGGQVSNAAPLTICTSAPGLFTSNGSGSGPAAILNQDNKYNGPTNPAAKGSYVVMYTTGEGQTGPQGVTGKVTSVSSTAPVTPQPMLPVVVMIGGQPATVIFYGEAPGTVAGVMQLNVQIPSNAPSGNLPVSVQVGGNSSQDGVTVSVQ
jgi:uncharacterized protein (TIGR03437 family)